MKTILVALIVILFFIGCSNSSNDSSETYSSVVNNLEEEYSLPSDIENVTFINQVIGIGGNVLYESVVTSREELVMLIEEIEIQKDENLSDVISEQKIDIGDYSHYFLRYSWEGCAITSNVEETSIEFENNILTFNLSIRSWDAEEICDAIPDFYIYIHGIDLINENE